MTWIGFSPLQIKNRKKVLLTLITSRPEVFKNHLVLVAADSMEQSQETCENWTK